MIHQHGKRNNPRSSNPLPYLKALVARDGEVVVTDRGNPAFVLRPFVSPPHAPASAMET